MSEFINTIDALGDDVVIDSIIERTITEFKDNTVTNIGESAFYGCQSLSVVDIPNVTKLGKNSFKGCTSLAEINLPNVTAAGGGALTGIAATKIVLPLLKSIENYQGFFPSDRWVKPPFRIIDVSSLEYIGYEGFMHNNPKAFILRNTAKVCVYQQGMGDWETGGYIYVPKTMADGSDGVAAYKAATTWSNYAERIRAIEDYTNDGTVTGSFFWCSGVELDKTSLTFNEWGSQTLTATMLTPSPYGFDVVEWSSSDPSIATVVDGVVMPISKGTATITASCNGYSATCEVEVNVNFDSDPIYSLASPMTFNGTSDYIDTGVKLFDTRRDFTILVKASFDTLSSNRCLIHCMNEANNYPGLSIDGNSGVRICYTGSSSLTTSITPASNVFVLALRYSGGVLNMIKYRNAAGAIVSHNVAGTPTYIAISQNLLLGAYQQTNGTKGRFFNGTIDEFKLYGAALNDVNVDALLTVL